MFLKLLCSCMNMDRIYMKMAIELSMASKCKRAKYGAIIVSEDGRHIGIGWNGKPIGSKCDHLCFREGLPQNAPKENCCIHAEVNAVINSGVDVCRRGTMYVTGTPCKDCALIIMQSGVRRLVYLVDQNQWNHTGSSNDQFWEKYGVGVERVKLSLKE